MEPSEIIRTIAKLHTRADRAERLKEKYEQARLTQRQGSAHIRQELEELVRVAEILYETNCRMGLVLDFLIGKQEIKQPDESPMSFDAMFNLAIKEAEHAAQPAEEVTDVHRSPSSPGSRHCAAF